MQMHQRFFLQLVHMVQFVHKVGNPCEIQELYVALRLHYHHPPLVRYHRLGTPPQPATPGGGTLRYRHPPPVRTHRQGIPLDPVTPASGLCLVLLWQRQPRRLWQCSRFVGKWLGQCHPRGSLRLLPQRVCRPRQ